MFSFAPAQVPSPCQFNSPSSESKLRRAGTRLQTRSIGCKALLLITLCSGIGLTSHASGQDEDLSWRSIRTPRENSSRLAKEQANSVSKGRQEELPFGPAKAATNVAIAPASCGDSTSCAYQLIDNRIAANAANFYVYLDADSGFNHGFASGFTGKQGAVSVDPACIDDPNGDCYSADDTVHLDQIRGTVLRVSFTGLTNLEYAGLNIEEPEKYGQYLYGKGYNLLPATTVTFFVRTPTGITASFGVGGCVTLPGFIAASKTWSPISVDLHSLYDPNTYQPCTPDLSNTHTLFSVSVSAVFNSNDTTILLDNIQFTLAPPPQPNSFSLPTGTQTFGVVPHFGKKIPTDEINRNLASIYEASLSVLTLLHRGQQQQAFAIADTLDYALFHDNHGVPIPTAPGKSDGCYDGTCNLQCGLHNAYINGSIAFYNDQMPGESGKAGDVRLAGFTGPKDQCLNGFCLVLDGATGGNNAWAILAFLAAYNQSNETKYLNDAIVVANWIVANLQDNTGTGYGGYYAGYTDGGPKILERGKSTENNSDIFAAFALLAHIEAGLGNDAMYTYWITQAQVAGDFVIAMYDSPDKRFYAGTVYSSDSSDPCGHSFQKGKDIINTCDYLDSDSFALLPMAASAKYRSQADWNAVWSYVLQTFAQSISADGYDFQGLTLENPPMQDGITWEFTGQGVEACNYLDLLASNQNFQSCAQLYDAQMQLAQAHAPFADGLGLVASTLPDGDHVAPDDQCLMTTYQCVPERVGLAATNWLIVSNENFNPMAFADIGFSPPMLDLGSLLVGQKVSKDIVVTSTGTGPLTVSNISLTGPNSGDFSSSSDCAPQHLLLGGDTCTVTVTFSPSGLGLRTASLKVADNGLSTPQTVPLQGVGLAQFYLLSVTKDGTGSGLVSSQGRQINCGKICSASIRGGYAILSGLPINDSIFDHWSGCDYVHGISCVVVLNQNRSVNATFNKRQR